jgi:hypothetical protein
VQLIDLFYYAKCIQGFLGVIYANFNKPLGIFRQQGLTGRSRPNATGAFDPGVHERPLLGISTPLDFMLRAVLQWDVIDMKGAEDTHAQYIADFTSTSTSAGSGARRPVGLLSAPRGRAYST